MSIVLRMYYFLGRAYICVFDKQLMANGVIGQHGQNALLSVAEPDNSGTGRAPPLFHVPQEAHVPETAKITTPVRMVQQINTINNIKMALNSSYFRLFTVTVGNVKTPELVGRKRTIPDSY